MTITYNRFGDYLVQFQSPRHGNDREPDSMKIAVKRCSIKQSEIVHIIPSNSSVMSIQCKGIESGLGRDIDASGVDR